MTEPPSRSLQLLDALEAQLDHLTTVEADLQQWQALAERRRKQFDRCEDRLHRATIYFSVERDTLKQERNTALDVLARLTERLLPLLKAPEGGDLLHADDLEPLRTVTNAAISLLSQKPDLAPFLDNPNLDNTQPADPA